MKEMDKIVYKDEYNHIISFGCMCSCAIFLKKNGFRDASYFFDWLTSDFFHNLEIIKNDFNDVNNSAFFKQEYDGYPHMVTNEKYGFIYTHVFDTKKTYEKQKKGVDAYINKRIKNTKKAISDNALLLYYCRDLEEQRKIEESSDLIKDFSKRFSLDFAFVFNNAVNDKFPFKSFIIPYNNIHYPIGGGVSFPFENGDLEKLIDWLKGKYNSEKIAKNLKHKTKKNYFKAIINRLNKHKKNRLKF